MGDPQSVTGLHVLLAGGGTGGHIFPAMAVAAALVRRGGRATFVGSDRGLEAKLVPEIAASIPGGVPFHALPAKPLLGRGLADKLRALWTLVGSSFQGRALVKEVGAQAVLGTGGYASAGPVLGAWMRGLPIVLLEPNADPGAANRMLSRFADGACVAFAEAGGGLRCRTWLSGVPVRDALFAVDPALPSTATSCVLVLGGSQGARQLNELLPQAVAGLDPTLPLRIVHQCGATNVESTQAAYAAAAPARAVEVVPFIDDVPAALGQAHLVVSRAGAITLAELCAAGRPAILVPLSIAAGHQRGNAEALEQAGAARVVPGDAATAERLAGLMSELLRDRAALQSMAGAARRLGRPGAADVIVDRIAEVAAQRRAA